MVACLPDLLARLSLPQLDMQESVWAEIILKTSSLALAFLTIVLSVSISKVRSTVPCFLVCFYLKVVQALKGGQPAQARDIDINCLEKLRRLEWTVRRWPVVPAPPPQVPESLPGRAGGP
jgi:hypothetical protein